jgi:hypothetical protein
MAENPENHEYWHCSNYHVCRNKWEDENNLCKSCSSQGKSSYAPTVRKVAVQSYSASEISTVAPSESISENTEKTTYKRPVKRRVMEQFQNKRDQMIEFFDHLDAKVSFTTDCWTSPNGITF